MTIQTQRQSKPTVPEDVRDFLTAVSRWAAERGHTVREFEASQADGLRVALGPADPDGPAEGFALDPMPPLRTGGEWVVEIYNLENLETIVAYSKEGGWWADLPHTMPTSQPVRLDEHTFFLVLETIGGGSLAESH